MGNYVRAIDSCTRALGIRGDWGPAYLCRSEARLFTKDLTAASQDAKKAENLDPKNGEPFRILGILEYEAGRYPEAVKCFNQALRLTKIKPENISDVYYLRASSHLNLGDFQPALKDVEEGLGVLRGINGDYGDWKFYQLRADIYRHLGNEARADADENKVVKLIDERIQSRPGELLDLLRARAESHMLLRDYAAAAKDLDRLLVYNGDDLKTLVDQANAYSLAGRHKEAVGNLDRVLRADPTQLPALRLRSMERFTLGDTRGALSDLDAALSIKPDDAASLTARGILKRYIADYRGSLKDLNGAQALNPDDSSLWGHKAFVLEMLGNHDTAMNLAEKTLKQEPDNASAHVALGLAAAAIGRCDAAIPSLDWLIRQSPDSGHYYWLRGECRCKSGQYSGCLEDIKTAQSLDPGSAFLALRFAQIHRRHLDLFPLKVSVKDLRDSQAYYDRAAALKPLDLASRLDRVRTMIELAAQLEGPSFRSDRAGLLRQAARECQRILKQYPNNLKARKLLKRTHQLTLLPSSQGKRRTSA